MQQLKLWKSLDNYVDSKTGEVKDSLKFYLEMNGVRVQIEVPYFRNKETGRDERYGSRKQLLSSWAEELPKEENNARNSVDANAMSAEDSDAKAPF